MHRHHLFPPFSFLLPIVLYFVLPPLSHSQSDTPSFSDLAERCKDPFLFKCGSKEYSISYPFTVEGEREGCSPPGYEIKCSGEDDATKKHTIKIGSEDMDVLDISYSDGVITVAERDVTVDTASCNVTYEDNTAINTTLYEYTLEDVNLTLYSCPSSNPTLLDFTKLNRLQCPPGSTSSGRVWFLGLGTIEEYIAALLFSCINTTVVIKRPPVSDPPLSLPASLQGALKQGFDVKWKAGGDWCPLCLRSGGTCGYNSSDPSEQTCYCSGGVKAVGSCKQVKGGLKIYFKILIGFAGVGVGILLAGTAWFLYRYRKRRLEKGNSSVTTSFFKSVTPSSSSYGFGAGGDLESSVGEYYQTPTFTYQELEEATGGFVEELGDGGFGTVYKGKLKDGRIVAIKCLHENTNRRVVQFRNEIEILNRLRHQNLVTLYGCSTRDSPKLLLVYEFVPNGTVADHLHGARSGERALNWPLRMSVAIESAAALSYLHAVKPQIIHRDVKTSNILLDSDFHVKVADFGLSRLFPNLLGITHVSTAPQGTPGYVDPEYHQCYQLTEKSDVYSFGVVLVELVTSMPAVDISRKRNEINLSNLAMVKIAAGAVGEIADGGLGYGSDAEVTRMMKAVCELAFRCLQQEREMRPTMLEVLEELKSVEAGENSYDQTKKKKKGSPDSRDDVYLLNVTDSQTGSTSSPPFSPNTVDGNSWPSRSTTPFASV